MAVVPNTLQTYTQKGIRESLADIITNISPMDTPFFSGASKGSATNTFEEWLTDSLAAADTANAQIEGDDVAFSAASQPTRLGNYTQISRKELIVSETAEAVTKAGRKSERSYLIAKKGKELKRDIESILLANQAAAAGAAAVARKTGSLLAFVKSNTSVGVGGAEPSYTNIPTATRTDGTQRAFTEDLVKDVCQKMWTAGADVDGMTLMVGAVNKQKASAFAGVATKTWNMNGQGKATIVGAADVYVSDFGTLRILPNRFQRARDAHFIDFEMVKLDFLRPIRRVPLAKTGDADKDMLITEYVLKIKQEAGLGLVADLTTT